MLYYLFCCLKFDDCVRLCFKCIEMGDESAQSSSLEKLLLTKSGDDLIIKRYKTEENSTESSSNSYTFHLNSLYSLLQDNQLHTSQNGFRVSLNKITSLDLSECGLEELPKCLKVLNLKTLNLSNNNLKQVPSCLYGSGLQELENLDLSFNEISMFDIEPDCILSLKKVKLNNNHFENVPKWFLTFRCIRLEEFNYSENKASKYDYLKSSVNISLMKLRHLELMNSCLLDKEFNLFKTLRCLEYLDISNNVNHHDSRHINKFRNVDKLFSEIPWKKLKILKLDNLSIAILPENLLWLESIKELYLSYNVISWIPEGFGYLVNLELLDISYNELVAVPVEIMYLVNLKVFKAAGNLLRDFPKLPDSIELLDLFDNYICDVENLNFGSENLKFMDFEYNYCDMSESVDYKEYAHKRDTFRNIYKLENRHQGPKNQKDSESESFSSRSDISTHSDYDFKQNLIKSETVPGISPEDDWDSEIISDTQFRYKNPDVTLSDNEWEGNDFEVYNKFYTKVYYPNEEDWIFVDAD